MEKTWDEIQAEQIAKARQADADRAERFAAQRAATAAKAAKGRYTNKGFDGRGNRVQDGAEWNWK